MHKILLACTLVCHFQVAFANPPQTPGNATASTASAPVYRLVPEPATPIFQTVFIGGNTHIRNQPGLVVPGATLDGDWIIVQGRPERIPAFLAGKPVTITSAPQKLVETPLPTKPDSAKPDSAKPDPAQFERQIAELKALLARSIHDPINMVMSATRPAASLLPESSNSPAPEAAQPSPLIQPVPATWEIKPADLRLATSFQRWANESGLFVLRWDAPHHFAVDAQSRFSGTPFQAIEAALQAVVAHHPEAPVEACIYNGNNPPVVRVTVRGDQANPCPN